MYSVEYLSSDGNIRNERNKEFKKFTMSNIKLIGNTFIYVYNSVELKN